MIFYFLSLRVWILIAVAHLRILNGYIATTIFYYKSNTCILIYKVNFKIKDKKHKLNLFVNFYSFIVLFSAIEITDGPTYIFKIYSTGSIVEGIHLN